jgi:hypothetical protein
MNFNIHHVRSFQIRFERVTIDLNSFPVVRILVESREPHEITLFPFKNVCPFSVVLPEEKEAEPKAKIAADIEQEQTKEV